MVENKKDFFGLLYKKFSRNPNQKEDFGYFLFSLFLGYVPI